MREQMEKPITPPISESEYLLYQFLKYQRRSYELHNIIMEKAPYADYYTMDALVTAKRESDAVKNHIHDCYALIRMINHQ